MTQSRFTAHNIANTLFDATNFYLPPMASPYGYGMASFITHYPHTRIQTLPSLEDAANALHKQGMSKQDLMLLGNHLRHFLITELTPELPEKDIAPYTHITTDPEAYLGVRLRAPLQELETRENLSELKTAFTASVSNLMHENQNLFAKSSPRKKFFGQRNFGLTRKHG